MNKSEKNLVKGLWEEEQDTRQIDLEKFNPESYSKTVEYKTVLRMTEILNSLGLILSLWLLLYPRPYWIAVLLNIILPIIGLFIYIKFNNYVVFDKRKRIKHPNVGTVVGVPSFVLILRAMIDFHILFTTSFWVCVIVVTLVILAIILLRTKEYKSKKLLLLLIAIVIFSYVFGTFSVTNCLFDRSEPIRYSSYVEDKHISRSRWYIQYYLTVKPWGPVSKTDDILVPKNFYSNVEIGEELYLYLKRGKWGVYWFIPVEKD